MPKGHPRVACSNCKRPKSETGNLSATGLCRDCGDYIMAENRRQLRAHSGQYFDHWRRRSLAALGVFVHDEAR